MSAAALLLCFTFGAALLAAWTDSRFPKLAPPSLKRRVAHMAVALVAVQCLAPIGMGLLAGIGPATPMLLVGLLGVFLPSLVYAFLGAVWVLRQFASALPGG